MSILKSILFYLAIGIDIIAILVAAGFLISDAIRQSSSSNGLLLLLSGDVRLGGTVLVPASSATWRHSHDPGLDPGLSLADVWDHHPDVYPLQA